MFYRSSLTQLERGYKRVAKPISLGIKAPHCCTSQTDCMLTRYRMTMTSMIDRVNRGSLKIYERNRAAENCGRLGAMMQGVVSAAW